MTAATTAYLRPGSLEEALAALAEHGEDAKLLAGGHSLLPLMKLRLATPAVLVDISGIRDLSYVRVEGEGADAVWLAGQGWEGHRAGRLGRRAGARRAARRAGRGARAVGARRPRRGPGGAPVRTPRRGSGR